MTPRFIEWIWHIKGSLALPPGQSSNDAFNRLDPLFRQRGTSHERTDDTLTFHKENQAPQDKMSVFNGGVLTIEKGKAEPVLHYHLKSKALLFCFLAPFLFLCFAGMTIAVGKLQKGSAEASEKAKKPEKKKPEVQMNPIDKALGAPEPEKPDEKKDKEKDKDKEEGPSPTPAYVFAGIFALLYLAGRVLEDRLVKSLFRKRLLGS